MTKLQSLLTELKRLEREANLELEELMPNQDSPKYDEYLDAATDASPVLIEACKTAMQDMIDLMYWLDKKEMSDTNTAVRNTLAQTIRKLDAICERGMK